MGTTESLSVPDRLENLSSSASAAPLVKLHEVTTNIGKGARGGGGGGGGGFDSGNRFCSSKYVVMAKILPQIIT